MAVNIRSVEFRREREDSWRRLERLVQQVEKNGLGSLSEKQLVSLPILHRAAVSALSVARAISLDRNLLEYLEGLTARSHFCVYGVRRTLWRAVREFATERFPNAVRAARWHLLLAAAMLLAGTLTGFALILDDPDRYYSLVSEGLAEGRDPSASTEFLRSALYDEEASASGMLTLFATFLFQHNTQVGILCFALGFAAGVPVFYLLFYNGLVLGAMSAVYHASGLSLDWWGWILPHGVTELLAIVLCGAAGLLQGQAVLFPGRRSRLTNLARAGRRAGVIVLGCVAMFFGAALLEGFFRQLVHSVVVRYSVVVVTAALWLTYFARGSRRSQ